MTQNLLAGLSSGLVTAGIIALATTGFSLQFGMTNFLNVAYGDYLTLAAFLWYGFAIALGTGSFPGLIIALVFTALFSVACNRFLFRQISKRYKARQIHTTRRPQELDNLHRRRLEN